MKSLSKKMLLIAALAFSGASVKADASDYIPSATNSAYGLAAVAVLTGGLYVSEKCDCTKLRRFPYVASVVEYSLYIAGVAALSAAACWFSRS